MNTSQASLSNSSAQRNAKQRTKIMRRTKA